MRSFISESCTHNQHEFCNEMECQCGRLYIKRNGGLTLEEVKQKMEGLDMQELQDLASGSTELFLNQNTLRCSIPGCRKQWYITGKNGRLCRMHFMMFMKLDNIIKGQHVSMAEKNQGHSIEGEA